MIYANLVVCLVGAFSLGCAFTFFLCARIEGYRNPWKHLWFGTVPAILFIWHLLRLIAMMPSVE